MLPNIDTVPPHYSVLIVGHGKPIVIELRSSVDWSAPSNKNNAIAQVELKQFYLHNSLAGNLWYLCKYHLMNIKRVLKQQIYVYMVNSETSSKLRPISLGISLSLIDSLQFT